MTDILDSRECTKCQMPMHIHPCNFFDMATASTFVCGGFAPEATPLPFTLRALTEDDQLELREYLDNDRSEPRTP